MIEDSDIQMFIYQHALQLTVIGDSARDAVAIAHETALLSFDTDFFAAGREAARKRLKQTKLQIPMPETSERTKNPKGKPS